jgi:hypothetical protein
MGALVVRPDIPKGDCGTASFKPCLPADQQSGIRIPEVLEVSWIRGVRVILVLLGCFATSAFNVVSEYRVLT